jgi:hypothetical protein
LFIIYHIFYFFSPKNKDIRVYLTKIRENFKLSGNQDAEDLNVEWSHFCTSYGDVYIYAFVVFPQGTMDNFGKALNDIHQRDTGALGVSSSNSQGSRNRARQRGRKRTNEAAERGSDNQGTGGHNPNSDGGVGQPNMLQGIQNSLQSNSRDQTKLGALSALAAGTDSRYARRASEQLARMAGVDTDEEFDDRSQHDGEND